MYDFCHVLLMQQSAKKLHHRLKQKSSHTAAGLQKTPHVQNHGMKSLSVSLFVNLPEAHHTALELSA